MAAEVFELEILGGATEKRFRRMRPEVEAMPWETLDLAGLTELDLVRARKLWTDATYLEHRTAAGCALTLRKLIEAQAPLDLVAIASRFPLDEVVHVELCARMAMEFGGGTEIVHDPTTMIVDPDPTLRPLMQVADCVVRFFCVGESLSIPLIRGQWHAAKHPLVKAVLGRIVKDEAAHGVFGFTFLDWASPRLTSEEKQLLGRSADRGIEEFCQQWEEIARQQDASRDTNEALGWMPAHEYLALARRSLETYVVAPLLARGIPIDPSLRERAASIAVAAEG